MGGMPEATGHRAGAFVVTGLAGLLAGAALMSLTAHGPEAESDPERAPLAAPDLVRELKGLAAELAALRGTLAHGPIVASDETRTPENLRADAGESAAIQSLADAVARLSDRLAAPAGSGGAAAFAVPVAVPAHQERIAKVLDLDSETLRTQHLLWTEQQVLDTYGRPTSIEGSSDSGVRWIWGSQPEPVFVLTILDGRVISANTFRRR